MIIGNPITLGGGGGLNPSDALIHVSAPYGATVTFTKGGVIVETITPDKAFQNADGATSDYYYPVKPENYGVWSLSATLGASVETDTITVDSNKEYSVKLMPYIFVNNGILNTGFQWNIDEYIYTGSAITQQSDGVRYATGGNIDTIFSPLLPCDLTKFSYLRMTITGGTSYAGGSGKIPAIAVGVNRPALPDGTAAGITGMDARTTLRSSTGSIPAGTYSLDISSLHGLYYIALSLGGSSTFAGESGWVKVTNFGLYN